MFAAYCMIRQSERPPKVHPNTVLHLKLSAPLPERTNNVQGNNLGWQNRDILGLHDLKQVLKEAKSDERIKGIFLDVEQVSLGVATARNLRQSLIEFRESGKFVLAHSSFYSQGAYYLATAADSVYLNPMGMINFVGLSADVMYYKNTLEKLGIKMEVFYAGQYKSATEPYRREQMSEENRRQIRAYIDELYGRFLTDISKSRRIPIPELQRIVNNWDGSSDALSAENKLVDRIAYEDEVHAVLREKLGLTSKDKIKVISPEKYFRARPPQLDRSSKNEIALLYAEGGFIGGEAQPGTVAENHYVKMIRKIRKSEKVKAIVLRINSGGGSAMASENIWRELSLARSENKLPVVISMGNVAASAAYMIAVASDSIFAEESSLTGSIGVFGMMPTFEELLNEKLGVTLDTVLTGHLAASFGPYRTFSDRERQLMQARVNESYASFLKKVADSRGSTVQKIDSIGQGRIWTGTKAQEVGLVDRIGSLKDAIRSASDLASIEAYQLKEYPAIKNPWQELIDQLMNPQQARMQQQKQLLQEHLGKWYPPLEFLYEINRDPGPQARLPFIIRFDQ